MTIFKLTVIEGLDELISEDWNGRGIFVAGRQSSCDIVLEDRSISRRHAEFFEQAGRVLVRDLGSLNGTYVNGVRSSVDRPLPIQANDLVRLGRVLIRVTEHANVDYVEQFLRLAA